MTAGRRRLILKGSDNSEGNTSHWIAGKGRVHLGNKSSRKRNC